MRRVRRFLAAVLFLHLTLLSAGGAAALNGADVAVYNDGGAPYATTRGVWQDGLTAIKHMVTAMGYTYEVITYADLNTSSQDFSLLYKVIIVPGGYAQWYNYWISLAGKQRIRNFVAAGGGYFGICAGSYFAADAIVWEDTSYGHLIGQNYWGEWTGYDLDLFPGIGTGPMNEIADWDTEHYNMTTLDFNTPNSVLSAYRDTPYSEDILYYGGPYFTIPAFAPVEILATYDYNNQPAIVAFPYGSGRVVLSGPHPEIEEDSAADGVTIARENVMDDKGSDWPLTTHLLLWLTNQIPAAVDVTLSSLSVLEGKPAGTKVGTFSTTGVVAGLPTAYTLEPGPGDTNNGSFRIVGNELRTAAVFNQYVKSSYDIRVRSSVAQAHRLTEKVFTITVTPSDVIKLSSATYSVGEAGPAVTITATRAGGSTGAIGVNYATADGTATAGDDYTETSGSLGWENGDAASKSFKVPIANDAQDEPNETFTVTLTSPTGGAILGTPSSATVTIADNDPLPTVKFSQAASSGAESAPAGITVVLTAVSSRTVTVHYATATGTATAGSDYTTTSGTLTFAPGVTSQPISIAVANDASYEFNETFAVTLTSPVNATLGSIPRHTRTIMDDDAPPVVQFTLAGSSGAESTTPAMINVGLSPASGRTVTVKYATANGTALSGSDYAARSGILTFAPGVTSRTISVPIVNNSSIEESETFTVSLTSPVNATPGAPTLHTYTIADEDRYGAIRLSSAAFSVGEAGPTATITATRIGGGSGAVSVSYSTADGTATAGSDYTTVTGSLDWIDGDKASRTFTVPVANDLLDEPNETFTVLLTTPMGGAILGSPRVGTVTITDNDLPPKVQFGLPASSGAESNTPAVIDVSLSAASAKTITVKYATANGTAVSGSDYTTISGTLTFTPGQTSRSISVPIINDTVVEPNQIFSVALTTPVNATLAIPYRHIYTIVSDDADSPAQRATEEMSSGVSRPTAAVTVNDFDGDGRSDYGVFDASSGLWSLRLSTGDDVTVQLGSDGSIPITGDFDGDGVTDFGCYTPATGTWEIVLSSGGLRMETFGTAGAIPVVGDFDGDGTADIGCYYPATPGELGSWQIMQSSNGLTKVSFGDPGSIPIGGTLR